MQTEKSVQEILGDDAYARLVAETRDFAIFLIDRDGIIASWNEGARLLFGWEKEEIVGQTGARLFVPEDRQSGVPKREIETASREGRAEDVRWHLKKDGTRFWANGVTTALRDEAGNLLGFSKVTRDETGRKRTEDELRQSQERFDLVARATNDAVWDWNLETDQIWWNGNLHAIFGYLPAVVDHSATWKNHIHPDDRERVINSIEQAINSGGQVWSSEYRFERADGSFAHVYDRGYALHDPAGRPVRMLGAMMDISERKKLETEKQIFEQFTSNSPNLISLCDLQTRFVYGNGALLRWVGVPDVEALKRVQIGDFFLAEDRDYILGEFLPRVLREGEGATEVRFRRFGGGEAAWIYYQAFLVRDADGQPLALAMVSRDISAVKQGEREREELLQKLGFERERLSAIFQSAPAFVAVIRGPQHTFEMVNPAYYQLVGHREIIGKTLLEALPEIEGQGFIEILDGVLASSLPFEGREVSVQLQRKPEGPTEERFVDLLFQPLFEADGTISGVFAHGVDITEQVRARRAAEEANRVKDEFLATLSHELRTPLTAILGWANILQRGPLSPADTERAVNIIERNARAQGRLIEDILDVSRVITGKLRLEVRPVDLIGIIEEALNTVTPAAQAKGIRLQRILDGGASIVSGDRARLQQIVWNLLSNAIKFTPKGGRVQIRLERINSHVEIAVSDNGTGIAPNILPYVFERFRQADSTSTRVHGGLGLGLSIVRHLAELHGGIVEARSDGLGQGATFTLKLPLSAARSANSREGDAKQSTHLTDSNLLSPDNSPRLDGLHVLVVDDQADTRVLLTALLQGFGARVTTVESAAQGLATLQAERPDVLLSDIGMPEEDGFSLIRRVRDLPVESGGQTPAVALTAFARVEDRINVLRSGFQTHLTKPVEPIELATVIATLSGRLSDEFNVEA